MATEDSYLNTSYSDAQSRNINTTRDSQVFKDLEYDSVLFPPRKMTGEAETLLSLDPSNLTIADELSFDDLIRTLLDD